VSGTPELEEAVRTHQDRIADEVLAVRISVGDDGKINAAQSVDIDGHPASIAFERAA
jgi:hypothetical protein